MERLIWIIFTGAVIGLAAELLVRSSRRLRGKLLLWCGLIGAEIGDVFLGEWGIQYGALYLLPAIVGAFTFVVIGLILRSIFIEPNDPRN